MQTLDRRVQVEGKGQEIWARMSENEGVFSCFIHKSPPLQKCNSQALLLLLCVFSDILKNNNLLQKSATSVCFFKSTVQSAEASISDLLLSITLQDDMAATPLIKEMGSPCFHPSSLLQQPSVHSVLFLSSPFTSVRQPDRFRRTFRLLFQMLSARASTGPPLFVFTPGYTVFSGKRAKT